MLLELNLEETNLFNVKITVKTSCLVNHILEIVTKASLKEFPLVSKNTILIFQLIMKSF